MGLFTDGFKLLKKASEPLYKTPKSIQEALNELPLEMKSKFSVLFGAMINQIKEQDVIN